MKMSYSWQMPNMKTFQIPVIKKLIKNEFCGHDYFDMFPYPFVEDAITYMKKQPASSKQYVVFDPPYTQRQLREMYHSIGTALDMNCGYWKKCRDEIARITKPGGKVISFGYNTTGIGKKNGFEKIHILVIAHGGSHNDTLCTVEVKQTTNLTDFEGMDI